MPSSGSEKEIAKALAEVDACLHLLGYDPNEARDASGEWTGGGNVSAAPKGNNPTSINVAPSATGSRLRRRLAQLHEDHTRITQRLEATMQEAMDRHMDLDRQLAANPKNKAQLLRWRNQAVARQDKAFQEHLARQSQVVERARKLLEPVAGKKSNQTYDVKSHLNCMPQVEAGANIWNRYASNLVDGPAVDIYSTNPKDPTERCYADPGGAFIAMEQNEPDSTTFAHEMGHILEARNPRILQASAAFVARRTTGETPQKLSVTMNDPRYKPNEVAKPDKFHHPYVGKVYTGPDGRAYATEVLAMGIQRLHHDPIEFAKNDPDYFDHVMHCLRGEV